MTVLSPRLQLMERIVTCERCELRQQCTSPVPFHGPTPAKIAVVGEAPGKNEDEEGRPFIGQAGKMIRNHLAEVGIDPETLFWTNTNQCYPHGTPTPEQVEACRPNKQGALDLADPTYVLLLGKTALTAQNPVLEMKKAHGRPFKCNGCVNFPTYHPAAALRNRKYEEAMHEDLVVLAKIVETGNWITHISDECSLCEQDHYWIDAETGVPSCEVHMPPEGHAWMQRVG